jgi:hypothetical protein
VGALAAEKTLIPAAARFDVGHANKWLGIHDFRPNAIGSQPGARMSTASDGIDWTHG